MKNYLIKFYRSERISNINVKLNFISPQIIGIKLISCHIISLLVGSLIYILFRASTLKVFSWFNFIGINLLHYNIRKQALEISPILPKWVLYSLPDGLWIFSYTCFMLFVWKCCINFKNIFWISVIPMIAILSEIFQGLGILEGTYDPLDLFFYLTGFILPFFLFKKSINYNFKF